MIMEQVTLPYEWAAIGGHPTTIQDQTLYYGFGSPFKLQYTRQVFPPQLIIKLKCDAGEYLHLFKLQTPFSKF